MIFHATYISYTIYIVYYLVSLIIYFIVDNSNELLVPSNVLYNKCQLQTRKIIKAAMWLINVIILWVFISAS